MAISFVTPRKTAATVTQDAAAAAGVHTPVDASAAPRTIALPTGKSEGAHLSIEKVDSSTNAVVVTGSVRGVAGVSISLTLQYESLELIADSNGSWRPTANNLLPASLAGIYAALPGVARNGLTGWFHADGFGAKGDGTTDDTVALQSCVTAAAAVGVIAYLPGNHRTTAPIKLPSRSYLRGDVGRTTLIRDFTTTGGGGGTLINADQTNGNTDITLENIRISAVDLTRVGKQISFIGVTKGKLVGVDIGTSNGDWMCTLKNCYDFEIKGGVWDCNGGNLYNDGLHIYGGGRHTVTGMRITAGDDAIALTAEASDCAWVEHVVVSNCVLESNAASSIKLGVAPYATAGIRHVRFTNITGRKLGANTIPIWAYDSHASDQMIYDVTLNGVTIDCQGIAGDVAKFQGVDGLVVEGLTIRNPNGRPFHIDGGTNSGVQTLTVNGAPTGGSYTLTDPVGGGTTAAIAYNAAAADIQSALAALPGLSGVTVTGAGPFVVTLPTAGTRLGWNLLTVANSLTGGSSPTVTLVAPNLQANDVVLSKYRQQGGQSSANQPNARIDRTTDLQILSPRVSGATGVGILVGSGGVCTDVLISGGTIASAAGAAGIRLVNVNGYRIANVRVKGCSNAVIEDSPSTNGKVRNNDFRGNTATTLSSYSSSNLDAGNNAGIVVASSAAPNLLVPPVAMLNPSATAWPAANRAIFARFTVPVDTTIRYVDWRADTLSGNYQVGIVSLSGSARTSFIKVVASTVAAMSGLTAGDQRTDIGATTLPAGDYAVFLWLDNTTATVRYGTGSGISSLRVAGQASNLTGGIPNTGSLAWSTTYIAATIEADV